MSKRILNHAKLGALMICAVGALHACGGGGGGGGDNPSGNTSGGTSPQLSGWEHESYIKASNGDTLDGLGNSVAVSGDTLVVAARNEASNQTTITNGSAASLDNSAVYAGAVYVFKRTGATWTQQAYLKSPNAEKNDGFGSSVAIDGDTIVVGASGDDSAQAAITNGTTASTDNSATNAGSAYVFVRNGDSWTQQAYLKAHNAGGMDQFGWSVAISGNTVVVGAVSEASKETLSFNGPTGGFDNLAPEAGAAYIYTRSGTTWSQQAYLKAPNAHANSNFGYAVAIDGDTAVIGAHNESSSQTTITNGNTASTDQSAGKAGAAYVFKRTGSDWTQQAYLKAPNANANDNFGISVAISGDTVVVGADGEDSNQTTITNGTGASADNSQTSAGAAYVFTRSGNQWAQQAYLKAASVGPDSFGHAIAINGDTIVVGAFGDSSDQATITNGSGASSNNSAGGSGAAYVFKRIAGLWAQTAYIKAPNTKDETDDSPGDQFGWAVAIDSNTIAIGARYEDSNQRSISNGGTASSDNSSRDSGAAYAFRRYP